MVVKIEEQRRIKEGIKDEAKQVNRVCATAKHKFSTTPHIHVENSQ